MSGPQQVPAIVLPASDQWPAAARFEDDPRAVRADRHGPKPQAPRFSDRIVLTEGRGT